jgi:alpha-mannosidase
MKKRIISYLLCLMVLTGGLAQSVSDNAALSELGKRAHTFIVGYQIHHEKGLFQYHSVLDATSPSLLCRSNTEPIEWQSASVPEQINSEYIDFLWLVSLDAAEQTPTFFFYINQLKRFSFSQGTARSWQVDGESHSELSYYHVSSDRHGDTHGYLHARIPASWVKAGEPVEFKIAGDGKGTNEWIQVYRGQEICKYLYNKASRENSVGIHLKSDQISVKAGKEMAATMLRLTLDGDVFEQKLNNKGEATWSVQKQVATYSSWQLEMNSQAVFGGVLHQSNENYYIAGQKGLMKHIEITYESDNTTIMAQSVYQPKMVDKLIELSESKLATGTICLMNSSHQDIAWMDDVEKCIVERDTMLLSPLVQDGLAATNYSFDIEDALMIEEYLMRHPDKKGDILKLLDQGKITVGATYIQPYEEMYSGESLARQFYFGKKWLQDELQGYSADTYWNVDVPGRTMQMPQLMLKAGVPNLVISRQAKGVYGWASPDGSTVRAYSSGHYSLDYNGINRDFFDAAAYIADAVLFWKDGYNDVNANEAVMPILSDYDMSPAKDYSQLMEQWAAIKYIEDADGQVKPIQLPAIELTSTAQFMERIADNTETLNVIKGERPALWLYIHGPSHQKAIKASREGDQMMVNAEQFAVLDAVTKGSFATYPSDKLNEAWKAKIYPDHGWGGKNGDITDAIFEASYQKALGLANAIADEAINNLASRIKFRKKGVPIVLFNGLSWERQAPIEADLNLHEMAINGLSLIDSDGNSIPFQIIEYKTDEEGHIKRAKVEFIANVPAHGYATYYATAANSLPTVNDNKALSTLETTFYKINLGQGGLNSVIDKATGKELFDTSLFLAGDIFSLQSEGNGAGEFVQVQQPTLEGFEQLSAHQPTWQLAANGPVYAQWELRQPLKHAAAQLAVKVYKELPRIDVDADIVNWDGEMYREFRMAFPLAEAFSQVAYEVPYGILRVGQDEMQGPAGGEAGGLIYSTPCEDIHPRGIMNWMGAYNEELALSVSSSVVAVDYLDVKQPGKLTIQPILFASRHSCHWEGNPYPQTGNHHFHFSLSTSKPDLAEMNRNGIANNTPLLVVVNPENRKNANLPESLSLMEVSDPDVIISAIKKAEDNNDIVIRLYKTGQSSQPVVLTGMKSIANASKTNLIEEKVGSLQPKDRSVELPLKNYEIETIRLSFN